MALTGTSTVISSVIRTRNKSTWSVRRLTGWTWISWTRTGRAFLPSIERSTRAFGSEMAAELLEVVAVERDVEESMPWP